MRVYTEKDLCNLTSGNYLPLEAEKVYVVFGGQDLKSPTKAYRLDEIVEVLLTLSKKIKEGKKEKKSKKK